MPLTSLYTAEFTELSSQGLGTEGRLPVSLAKAAPEVAEVWVILGDMGELVGPPFSQHNHQMPTQYGWLLVIPNYPLIPKNGTWIIPESLPVPQMD